MSPPCFRSQPHVLQYRAASGLSVWHLKHFILGALKKVVIRPLIKKALAVDQKWFENPV